MKKLRVILAALLAVICLLSVAGCAGKAADPTPAPDVTATPTPDIATPSPTAVEPTAPPKVLLVMSFGTSYNNNRDLSIGGIEAALTAAYPDYEIRRAFTSQIIIDKLAARDGIIIDNVTQAMDRLVADGVKELVIQPTHVMEGFEYDDVVAEATTYADKFDSFKIGPSLLTSDEDYAAVAKIITSATKQYDVDGTAVIFMGHGTEHSANATYAKLQQVLTDAGYSRYFVGTVEATPTLEDVIALAKGIGASKVVLEPLMIVAGDHANNDMAGDDDDSWKSQFEAAGFEVECLLQGLGQNADIQQLIVKHVAETIAHNANPVYADKLNDGTYTIDVTSSSSMFRVVDAQLTVAGGKMSAVLTLSGTAYLKLYMGTMAQAETATDADCIFFAESTDGKYTYTVPVAALDLDTDCAAWSSNKDAWYDRVLVFESASLPAEAFK